MSWHLKYEQVYHHTPTIEMDEGNASKITLWISSLDAFPKVDTAYLKRTSSGGITSMLTFGFMALLMLSELTRYLVPPIAQYYVVDPAIGTQVSLHLDLSVASECGKLVVLLNEATGVTRTIEEHLSATDEDFNDIVDAHKDWVKKLKVAKSGDSESYENEYVAGCRIRGIVPVNKIGGRLIIAPLVSTMGAMGEMLGQLDDSINFSHYIHQLSFGAEYPGMNNPLDGANQLALETREHFTYFLAIIPTLYQDRLWGGQDIFTNQYSLNGFKGRHSQGDRENPGLFFKYDHEPLALIITRERTSFMTFIVQLVGILGGIYTCTSIVYRILFTAWVRLLWTLGFGAPRKNSARFDAGWSPVMGERPNIVKSHSIVGSNGLESDNCLA